MESIHSRAKKALAKARKEGRKIYFLIRYDNFYGEGEHLYKGVRRKDYTEDSNAYVQTWVEGDLKGTGKIEKI